MEKPASRPFQVASYYFPNYHPNDARNLKLKGPSWSEWELVKAARPRFPGHRQPNVPLWGYTDESDPSEMARKIAAAADHGIDAFIFDWYWYSGVRIMEEALERGFLRAPNRHRLKFTIMFTNHDWADYFPAPFDKPWNMWLPSRPTRHDLERWIDYAAPAPPEMPADVAVPRLDANSLIAHSELIEKAKTVEYVKGFEKKDGGFGMKNGSGVASPQYTYMAAYILNTLGSLDTTTRNNAIKFIATTPYGGSKPKDMPDLNEQLYAIRALKELKAPEKIDRKYAMAFMKRLYIKVNGGFGPLEGYGSTPDSTTVGLQVLAELDKLKGVHVTGIPQKVANTKPSSMSKHPDMQH